MTSSASMLLKGLCAPFSRVQPLLFLNELCDLCSKSFLRTPAFLALWHVAALCGQSLRRAEKWRASGTFLPNHLAAWQKIDTMSQTALPADFPSFAPAVIRGTEIPNIIHLLQSTCGWTQIRTWYCLVDQIHPAGPGIHNDGTCSRNQRPGAPGIKTRPNSCLRGSWGSAARPCGSGRALPLGSPPGAASGTRRGCAAPWSCPRSAH